MSAADGNGMRKVLLVEPDGLVRGTVASICRDEGLVQLVQATHVAQGEQALTTGSIEGMVLSLSDEEAALSLLARVRAGEFGGDAAMPVAVIARGCTPGLAAQLKALNVKRLLVQPFKLRDVIHTLEQLWPLVVPDVVSLETSTSQVS